MSLFWKDVKPNIQLSSQEGLTATVVNNSPNPVAARISVLSAGLDGKLVEAPIAALNLKAKATHDVHLTVGDLPIQSELATSFAVIQAELARDDGAVIRVPTTPLYYHFEKNYAQAVFQSPEDVAASSNGGILSADPLDVRGRVRQTDGSFRDVLPPSGEAPMARQGLSGARAFPVTEDKVADEPDADGLMMAPMGLTSAVELCPTWLVQYIDSNFGEDVWPTSAWQYVPAKFVRMKVLLPGGAVYWQGQADVNGCATVQLAPGSYQLLQYTDDVKAGGVTVSSYHVQNGVPYWYGLFTNFSVSGPASLHLFPTFNNDAVQAAAVAGQALAAHQFNGGMGFLPGTYRIHTNDGCTAFPPYTDSCFDPNTEILHVGTTQVNGYTDAHWKFVIGHELGHMVQYRAMGWIHNIIVIWRQRCSANAITTRPNGVTKNIASSLVSRLEPLKARASATPSRRGLLTTRNIMRRRSFIINPYGHILYTSYNTPLFHSMRSTLPTGWRATAPKRAEARRGTGSRSTPTSRAPRPRRRRRSPRYSTSIRSPAPGAPLLAPANRQPGPSSTTRRRPITAPNTTLVT